MKNTDQRRRVLRALSNDYIINNYEKAVRCHDNNNWMVGVMLDYSLDELRDELKRRMVNKNKEK